MTTKVRIPKEHFLFYRKVYEYLHHTKSVPSTNHSFLNFSQQLLSHYLGRHSKKESSDQETEKPTLLFDENRHQVKPTQSSHPLEKLHQKIYRCKKCFLGERRKNKVVLPRICPAPLMVVTDIPSFYDETQGHYFRDEAGKLLIRIIESLEVDFKKVYYTGAIKCASSIEISNQLERIMPCQDYFYQEMVLVRPKFMIFFGEDTYRFFEKQVGKEIHFYSESLRDQPIVGVRKFSEIRGQLMNFFSVEGVMTHHPRELIFDPGLKRQVWNDLKPFKEKILTHF